MRRTQQTLLEQMQLGDIEIQRRKQLLGLSDEDLKLLSRHQNMIEDSIDIIVDEFYERQSNLMVTLKMPTLLETMKTFHIV